jgi:3-dehydroquinate synthase
VRCGPRALDALVRDLRTDLPGRLLVLVSDSNVAPLHAEPLARRLRRLGLRVELVCFPAGEASKTRETKAAIEDRLAELGAGRDAAIVAVGGGVTTDLAGFVAATWNRGVPVVQVPTSLVAMVDAALGGKTGINHAGAKNRLGAFHQPWGVYADLSVLSTLPEADFRAGFAEVVKSAVIADARLFAWLEEQVASLIARRARTLRTAVAACLGIKARIVGEDEREAGRRSILNFGHTVGHGLEAATTYTLSHGQAVACGMSVEGELATRCTGFSVDELGRLRGLLDRFGLPVAVDRRVPVEAVLEAVRGDKKNRDGQLRFALPVRIGRMAAGSCWTVPVREKLLRSVLARRAGV